MGRFFINLFMKKYFCILLFIFSVCFALLSLRIKVSGKLQYDSLNEYLKQYEIIKKNGGWPKIITSQTLKIGMSYPEIKNIKKRLSVTGELTNSNEYVTDTFDIKLKKAIITFQRNHSLKPTGIIDKKTLYELNVGIDYRIHQIKVNMNRWQNLTSQFENYYILVNIASGNLELIEDNSTKLKMRVIIGRYYRQTPVFSSYITMVDFNPYWVIPPGIFKKDILPKLKANPNYANERNMYVTQNNKIVRSKVNWNAIEADSPYTLIQKPGPKNPLGVIKFIFPNKYFVYMHDTPDKNLFDVDRFNFSSGCIRLSQALELGEYLLNHDQNWTRQKIDSVIAKENNYKVTLLNPVKIYICYFTAWVNRDGSLQFTKDIYNRD